MRALLNKLWKSITWFRIFTLNTIFLLVLISIVIAIMSSPRDEFPQKAALFLAPSGYLVDQLSYEPSAFDLLQQRQPRETETLVSDLIESIHRARGDERITAIVMRLDYLTGGGLSKLEEIGIALEKFKSSGKPVIAYADSYSQQQYFLASFADEIYVNDMGSVLLTGYGLYRNYMKDAADKLSIKFQVFRVGDYKDAVEPYIRNSMSEASREHNSQWLNELWARYTDKVESLRGMERGAINNYIREASDNLSKFSGSSAEYAKKLGLIDEAVSRVTLREHLIKRFGQGKNKGEFSAVGIQRYLSATKPLESNNGNIGLIVARGTILDGKQPNGSIGGDSLSELIRTARHDKSLKALIIRVDSGGGSAFASEVIRNEIIKTREQGLAVYVSMGSVAASGGYWISTAANEIWATPSTLTGSIGVWGLYPNVSSSINRLGIYTDGVGTTELAGAFRLDRAPSNEANQLIQSSVNNIYRRFLQLVAEARQSDTESIHNVAQGRVWTGQRALDLGLVDHLGYLDDVVNAAAKQQALDSWSVKMIEKPLSAKEQLLRALLQEANALSQSVSSLVKNDLFGQYLTVPAIIKNDPSLKILTENVGESPRIFSKCMECYTP